MAANRLTNENTWPDKTEQIQISARGVERGGWLAPNGCLSPRGGSLDSCTVTALQSLLTGIMWSLVCGFVWPHLSGSSLIFRDLWCSSPLYLYSRKSREDASLLFYYFPSLFHLSAFSVSYFVIFDIQSVFNKKHFDILSLLERFKSSYWIMKGEDKCFVFGSERNANHIGALPQPFA